MALSLLLILPWIGVLAFLLFVVRIPRELPPPGRWGTSPPFVSVIVPARNEAENIEACVSSLTASRYHAFEVIVVDDQSEDPTADIVGSLDRGFGKSLRVVAGEDLPPDWLGKPWACHQGAAVAKGELLLFTDADTRHGPDLLARAVGGLHDEGADLLTVVGRQVMETFWERVVQPQIFMLMLFRFPRFETIAKTGHWRNAIANGQYMLFRRVAYDAIGGHEGVKDEVVEDLVLAQRVKRAGLKLRIRGARTDLATRMYRSLPDLIQGWSKNIIAGGQQSLPPWMRLFAPPLSLAVGAALWLAPPVALLLAVLGVGGPGLMDWATKTSVLSAAIWVLFTWQMGGPPAYGLLFPAGAAVAAHIFHRSWKQGSEVQWKGRRYTLRPTSDEP